MAALGCRLQIMNERTWMNISAAILTLFYYSRQQITKNDERTWWAKSLTNILTAILTIFDCPPQQITKNEWTKLYEYFDYHFGPFSLLTTADYKERMSKPYERIFWLPFWPFSITLDSRLQITNERTWRTKLKRTWSHYLFISH